MSVSPAAAVARRRARTTAPRDSEGSSCGFISKPFSPAIVALYSDRKRGQPVPRRRRAFSGSLARKSQHGQWTRRRGACRRLFLYGARLPALRYALDDHEEDGDEED